jgi:beta-mannosidase
MGHILQGDVIKTAIEAHRRDKGYCWGTLFWQHNDCWPVASWSSRDWYGVWKAQHYFARQAYGDILVSPVEKDGVLSVYVVSDRREDVGARLEMEILPLDGSGSGIRKYFTGAAIKANSGEALFSESVDSILQSLKGMERGDVVVHVELTVIDKDGSETDVYENNYFLCRQKEMNYPEVSISRSVKPVEGGYEVTVGADKFARGVFLSIEGTDHFFSDNYFDLLPGRPRTVTVSTSVDEAQFMEQLEIVSLVDAY